MYVPYAAVYYVVRVHLMCSINAACHHLTMWDYLTTEIIIMVFGVLLHIPLWSYVLLLLDIKKNGGNVNFFKVSGANIFLSRRNITDANRYSNYYVIYMGTNVRLFYL